MSKHMPGPWAWYQPQSTPSLNPYCAAFVIGPKRVPMDKVDGFTVDDARLISAAPDLLEALDKMLDHFEGSIPLELFEIAESAIAKAKGL